MQSMLHLVILSIYLTSTNSYVDFSDLTRRIILHTQRHQSLKHNNSYFDNDASSKYGSWIGDKKIMQARSEDAENYNHHKADVSTIEDRNDIMKARQKALVLSKAKGKEAELNELNVLESGDLNNRKMRYHMDPVFNVLRSGSLRRDLDDDDSEIVSSSRELGDFKEQFKELWLQKKYEALNSTLPSGDQVNMVAARPWGVKCGDPNQHDMPWGTCMLAVECDAEYRIYRGDIFCGRTSFGCCALEVGTYDMYQGFDLSFEDKGLSTDTEEMLHGENPNSKKKDAQRNKKKRKDARAIRKKKIKKNIKKIMKEINKILNRIYQNSSKQRKRRSKQMRNLIKKLKSEYKKDRLAVKDLHEEYMIQIDAALMKKLYEIKHMNSEFMRNATFASIVVNGTMSKLGARMLIQAYPELETYISKARRSSGGNNTADYLEYDVEYGFLYY